MAISHPPVVKISEHCRSLSGLLHALSYQVPISVKCDDETYSWTQPEEWLDVAASIVKVEVVTAQGDMSVLYCESALDYENDRSKLLSQFCTSLTVFSFVWGAFESIAKIMDPPSIPKANRRQGNDGLTARVVFALNSIKPDGVYYYGISKLRHWLTNLSEYKDCLPEGLGPALSADAGQGLDLVRRIRNKFAHGAAAVPQRHDWNGENSIDNLLVLLSCRMVLLTMQMMLRTYFHGRSFAVEVYEFDSDCDERDIHILLETLHLASGAADDDQSETGPNTPSQSD